MFFDIDLTILAAVTIWLASKLQPNRAESPQPQEPKT